MPRHLSTEEARTMRAIAGKTQSAISAERKRIARKMYDDGVSVATIAKTFGVRQKTVYRYLEGFLKSHLGRKRKEVSGTARQKSLNSDARRK